MVNPMELIGRRILVTGASSGIGRACAILLSRLGASVVLVARDEKRLNETLKQMTGSGHTAVTFDLTDLERYEELFNRCGSEQKLNGIVHAAGVGPAIPIQYVSIAAMREVMTINYFAFMELVKWFSKKKYSAGGSIVAISSISAKVGWLGGSLYCGSKGALDASIRALALELVAKNIRVNSVVPSNIQTPMLDDITSVVGDEATRQILIKQPLGLGEPEDVANAIAFLLGDASRFITGTQLVVDGGYLAQ
ncbi:MAG: SDR family NAD(P)-dependent oxidoreductase [Kiritimatiellae bacterium]|nr:SDR family NAD(P)-dependent oxidoreductase [Kiritimatiellia bacterium]